VLGWILAADKIGLLLAISSSRRCRDIRAISVAIGCIVLSA